MESTDLLKETEEVEIALMEFIHDTFLKTNFASTSIVVDCNSLRQDNLKELILLTVIHYFVVTLRLVLKFPLLDFNLPFSFARAITFHP